MYRLRCGSNFADRYENIAKICLMKENNERPRGAALEVAAGFGISDGQRLGSCIPYLAYSGGGRCRKKNLKKLPEIQRRVHKP